MYPNCNNDNTNQEYSSFARSNTINASYQASSISKDPRIFNLEAGMFNSRIAAVDETLVSNTPATNRSIDFPELTAGRIAHS